MEYWGSDKIDDKQDATCLLTCVDHEHMVWSTKNLGFIGARSIFMRGLLTKQGYYIGPITAAKGLECDCPVSLLRPMTAEEIEGFQIAEKELRPENYMTIYLQLWYKAAFVVREEGQ
jgi:hypothetical protein